ncbi:MAG: hypothetical protein VKP62_03265 [Candidatus Sericytochromatia bacterium]|nr:hypothetical protein [Candidatus Sericytochromatia bacterium]
MPTKDLWFLPQGAPGRQYLLEYDQVPQEGAGLALALRMYRKRAAGDVDATPAFSVVLAFRATVVARLEGAHGVERGQLESFLQRTAERAAACLDMRLPPPLEPAVPAGQVVWLAAEDYTSERTLTHTLVEALG